MPRLKRDRSTPELDAWWGAVEDAARSAPRLSWTEERAMERIKVLEACVTDVLRQAEGKEPVHVLEPGEKLSVAVSYERSGHRHLARVDVVIEERGLAIRSDECAIVVLPRVSNEVAVTAIKPEEA